MNHRIWRFESRLALTLPISFYMVSPSLKTYHPFPDDDYPTSIIYSTDIQGEFQANPMKSPQSP